MHRFDLWLWLWLIGLLGSRQVFTALADVPGDSAPSLFESGFDLFVNLASRWGRTALKQFHYEVVPELCL
jgi:hypothetical protein